MSETFARDALLFAGEMFLLSAVILALAWEAAQAIRNRAALRHLVWVGGFFALIALPVLALIVPSQFHFAVPSAPAVSEHVMTSLAANVDAAPVAAAPVAQAPARFTMPDIHVDLTAVATVLFAMWLVGVIALALRGAAAAIGLRALKRSSRPHSFTNGELIVGPRYEIRLSREPNGYGPITWGLFRPVILLPFNALFWPRERLQAVLLHETAHIARRDSISQMLSMIACALYWPNPLVWMASRALRNEAEIAADDAVIASGIRPSSYAGELLQLASEFRSREPALAGMPLFMAGPSALEARVKSVLAATPYRSGVTAKDVLRISSIALLATTALTFARPSFAQEETSTPSSPATVTSAPLLPPVAGDVPSPPTPPPAPAALPTPPAPPAVAILRSADSKPYFGVHESDRVVHGHHVHHVWVQIDTRGMSEAKLAHLCPEIEHAKAQARAAEAQARTIAAQAREQARVAEAQARTLAAQARAQARVADAQAREQARAAEAQAQDAERQAREIQERMPLIRAQVEAEIAKIRPAIERAVAQARFERTMNLHIEMNDRRNDAPDDEADGGPDSK
jgi:beta-lactamase regulating signal transducer with metallopeptidase domain